MRLLGTEEQELQGRRLARPYYVQDKNWGEISDLVQKLTMANDKGLRMRLEYISDKKFAATGKLAGSGKQQW